MKDDKKDTECCCCCGGAHHYAGKTHLVVFIGLLMMLWGAGHYIRIMYLQSWPPYSLWIIGGVILIVIGWLKKYWMCRNG